MVMSTKYRRKILAEGMGEYLKQIVKEISKHHPEIQVLEANVDRDHMHLLVSIAPKYSISEAVNLIKSNTGGKMRRKFPWLDKVYYGSDGIWAIGYFVSTVGLNEEQIKRYIELQGKEDSGQAELEIP